MDLALSRQVVAAVLDTNVIVRHLTGTPAAQARRASAFLASGEELVVTDVVVAECAWVLESVYRVPRSRVALLLRSLLALPSTLVRDAPLLDRALELYETGRFDYTDAYLVAQAEMAGIGLLASFDRELAARAPVAVAEP